MVYNVRHLQSAVAATCSISTLPTLAALQSFFISRYCLQLHAEVIPGSQAHQCRGTTDSEKPLRLGCLISSSAMSRALNLWKDCFHLFKFQDTSDPITHSQSSSKLSTCRQIRNQQMTSGNEETFKSILKLMSDNSRMSFCNSIRETI